LLLEQQHQTDVLERQAWVSRGRAQLAEGVREGLDGTGESLAEGLDEGTLAGRVLACLCEYGGAQVGVLYGVAADGHELALRAAFGCASGTGVEVPPPRVLPGEGWLGRVAQTRRRVTLSEVPETHVRVVTATGSSPPRHLVVAPLLASGRLVGVVELGFLTQPGLELDGYLDAIAEPAGALLLAARYQAHLRELLEATQRQAEELQAQQEELRVANEELHDQSEELRQSQGQLESQQEELEVTNTNLAEQARALERQRDELAAAQAGLVEKADELARANQYKSEFLANMSHELRTPLNSSLILAKLLADNSPGNLTPEQVEYARTIYGAGNDLLTLINDILDLSRIEAGHVDIDIAPLPVASVLGELDRTFRVLAADKGLAFSAASDPGAPEQLDTDRQRLLQILKNLVSNAIKFTSRGEVAVRVRAVAGDRIAFAVRDTGIGIPRDKQAVIFEAFRQADGSTHRQYGGTGLGLTISRDLAMRLGGDLQVESTPGEGSTFVLVLPVQAAKTEAAGAPAPTVAPSVEPRPATVRPPRRPVLVADDRERLAAGGRLVLIVEDDVRFARILLDLAHEKGFLGLVATTVGEASELARAHRPSAIVLDVNLPDESGLTLLEQLKHSGDTRHIPVHVVSVMDHSRRALELGAVGYAVKPVDRDELIRAFDLLRTKLDQERGRVLVVEDAEVQRESLRALLGSERVEIVAVGTAAEALEQLRLQTFDCMVLDLGLPDKSGYELLEQMSSDAALSFPPVIVYTGRALTANEELRLRRYSSAVVIKGARSPERLLDEVTLFLHRVESSLPREQQRMLREARSREAAFEGRRVLLAEDDVRNIFALTSVLEPRGALVEVARNGQEALELLASADGNGGLPVDLVLMDLMMPVVDGLTAIREIRKRPEWRKLPVIAITAKAMADDRDSCLAAGASDYIAKPIDVEKLLSLMRVWMPK
jgi:signal transduction histidine kinase/PleD family two-component response regulator